MEIVCAVQNYEWGVRGNASSVAQLAGASQSAFTVDKAKPYAELWMGTHPNGPSVIKSKRYFFIQSLCFIENNSFFFILNYFVQRDKFCCIFWHLIYFLSLSKL